MHSSIPQTNFLTAGILACENIGRPGLKGARCEVAVFAGYWNSDLLGHEICTRHQHREDSCTLFEKCNGFFNILYIGSVDIRGLVQHPNIPTKKWSLT